MQPSRLKGNSYAVPHVSRQSDVQASDCHSLTLIGTLWGKAQADDVMKTAWIRASATPSAPHTNGPERFALQYK